MGSNLRSEVMNVILRLGESTGSSITDIHRLVNEDRVSLKKVQQALEEGCELGFLENKGRRYRISKSALTTPSNWVTKCEDCENRIDCPECPEGPDAIEPPCVPCCCARKGKAGGCCGATCCGKPTKCCSRR